MIKVTTSQLKCFKTCRRRYYLEYVKNLKPIETPKPLAIGTLYHYGLELFLKHRMPFEDIVRAMDEFDKKNYTETDGVNVTVAIAMVEGFITSGVWRNWNIKSIEQKFEVSTGYGKRLIGKIDGLIEKDGKFFLIEHKTTTGWGEDGSQYLNNLLLDEQATNYLYAYSRLLEDGIIDGKEVSGIFYNVIEKPTIKRLLATPEDQRRYTKDGRLYASQRERDETLEEYAERLYDWYREKNRIHTNFVYRTPQEINEHVEDINACLRDLTTCEKESTWYRNPEACKILVCPYSPKCVCDTPDTDCLFTSKIKTNEEL